jgi:hypothetical protein
MSTFLIADAISRLAHAQAHDDPAIKLSFLVSAEEILRSEIREARAEMRKGIVTPEEHKELVEDTEPKLSHVRDQRRSA